jgi:hypothetical protein
MATYRSNCFKQVSGLLADVSERPDERQHQAIIRSESVDIEVMGFAIAHLLSAARRAVIVHEREWPERSRDFGNPRGRRDAAERHLSEALRHDILGANAARFLGVEV